MKIHVETIPHGQQAYNTCGNYWIDEEGTLQIRISEMGGLDYEIPVLLHELVEWFLCQKRGIKLDDIDSFDKIFELERALGRHVDQEPGDSPEAPYTNEHRFAENIERQVVHEAGMRWDDYDERVSREWASPRSLKSLVKS